MSEDVVKKLEGLLLRAVQSGKQETSGLVTDIKKDIAVLKEHLSNQDKVLSRIEEQTTKHNGRMRNLELWRSYIVGGLSVMGIVLCLVAYIWNKEITTIQTKQTNIVQAFNDHMKTVNEIKR